MALSGIVAQAMASMAKILKAARGSSRRGGAKCGGRLGGIEVGISV